MEKNAVVSGGFPEILFWYDLHQIVLLIGTFQSEGVYIIRVGLSREAFRDTGRLLRPKCLTAARIQLVLQIDQGNLGDMRELASTDVVYIAGAEPLHNPGKGCMIQKKQAAGYQPTACIGRVCVLLQMDQNSGSISP